MFDAYLKFADPAEALAAFETAGIHLEAVRYHDTALPEGMLIVKAVGPACDGAVYAPTGETETDAEGFEYPALAAVPGFHLNVRLADETALPGALEAFLVAPQPQTPTETFS